MKALKPLYYDYFICTASECKNTCCEGWKIPIDKSTYIKYSELTGEFAEVLNKNVSKEIGVETYLDYGKMDLKNNICPFLNKQKLCDIYINLGEGYLCNTCKLYPRGIELFGEIYEKTLDISCPEVVRLLMSSDKPFAFVMEDEEISDLEQAYIVKQPYDDSLYNLLWQVRSFFIDIAQMSKIPLWKRLVFIKLAEKEFQKLIDTKQYNKLDDLITQLSYSLNDTEALKALDDIRSCNEIKIGFTNAFIKSEYTVRTKNVIFTRLIEEYHLLLQTLKHKNDFEYLEVIEEEFNQYFKEREYILENYIVHTLYNNCMKVLRSNNLDKEIFKTMIFYSIVKRLLIARWCSKQKELSQEDIIDVICSFSRVLEHNEAFINTIYKELNDQGYNTLGGLTVLVR